MEQASINYDVRMAKNCSAYGDFSHWKLPKAGEIWFLLQRNDIEPRKT